MNGNRRDFGNRKPQDRLLRPHISYPTYSTQDSILVEDVQVSPDYVPLIIGTPRDGWPKYLLVDEEPLEGNESQQIVRRTWASSPRLAEHDNAAALRFFKDCTSAATYIRTYTVPAPYTPATEGAPLTAILGLTLTDGGIDYTSARVEITGTGTGAAGSVQIRNGAIVAIQITNSGTGYTETPTVEIIGDGTGATATAYIQPQNAVLVSQSAVPEGGRLDKLFLRVTHVYQVLPSKIQFQLEDDGETDTPAAIGEMAIATPTLPLSRLIGSFLEAAVDATTDTITLAGHGMPNGLAVMVASSTALPTGLSPATNYFTINVTADTFQLSIASNGAAINMTDAGTGTHYLYFGSGTKLSYHPKGCTWGILTTASLLGWDQIVVTSTENGHHETPTMVLGFNAGFPKQFVARDGTSRCVMGWVKDPRRSRPALITTVHNYGPALSVNAIYNVTLVDLTFEGVLGTSFHHGAVLTENWDFSITSGTENAKWPYIIDSYAATATSPSPSGYISAMATGQRLSSVVRPWKYGLKRRTDTTVQLI